MIQSRFHAVRLGGAMLLTALMASACATDQYVQQQIQPVQQQAQQAQQTAERAQQSADQAQGTANEARSTANEAVQRADAAQKTANGKIIYEEVLSDDAVKFPVSGSGLSSEAEARLTSLADKLKSDNTGVYLEVQGFTDNTGNPSYNQRLGEMRAEAVRHYLRAQGIPLSRMSTISYGEAKPIAPNSTAQGRAQNRRVVILVLK